MPLNIGYILHKCTRINIQRWNSRNWMQKRIEQNFSFIFIFEAQFDSKRIRFIEILCWLADWEANLNIFNSVFTFSSISMPFVAAFLILILESPLMVDSPNKNKYLSACVRVPIVGQPQLSYEKNWFILFFNYC